MTQSKPKKALKGLFVKTEKEVVKSVNEPVQPKEQETLLTKIQFSFETKYNDRLGWKQSDYELFLRRLDHAQNEAFLLKGKLISEIKDRFFLNNKIGWDQFCEETLNMNYTTANQYIRVALEFDVTSHQRVDFGFEHFKALLPVEPSKRTDLLKVLPKGASVKALRDVVKRHQEAWSNKEIFKNQPLVERNLCKNIVFHLEKLNDLIDSIESEDLQQENKWKLYGAFKNVSQKMEVTIKNFFPVSDDRLRNGAVKALEREEVLDI